jgi:hypothetical protein
LIQANSPASLSFYGQMITNVSLFLDDVNGLNLVFAEIPALALSRHNVSPTSTVLRPSDNATYYPFFAISTSPGEYVDASTTQTPMPSTVQTFPGDVYYGVDNFLQA